MSGNHRAVFLDRDGVINRDSPDFIKTAEELEILTAVPEAVAKLNRLGFLVFVITNQSGVARGLLSHEDLDAIHAKLGGVIAGGGGSISGIYHCPHVPEDGCDCRKPKPGMILEAAREHDIDLRRSYLVGDKPTDIECGASVGLQTILVLSGLSPKFDLARFPVAPDQICDDLTAAASWIESSFLQSRRLDP